MSFTFLSPFVLGADFDRAGFVLVVVCWSRRIHLRDCRRFWLHQKMLFEGHFEIVHQAPLDVLDAGVPIAGAAELIRSFAQKILRAAHGAPLAVAQRFAAGSFFGLSLLEL